MRLKKSAALLACALAVAAIAGAGAVTASSVAKGGGVTLGQRAAERPTPKANRPLTSLRAIRAHLRALGVDPTRVVVQRGLRNYAGPDCPGAAWNCTTAKNVVQIARPGGVNRVMAASPQQQADCSVNQTPSTPSGNNRVQCRQRTEDVPTAAQDCGTIIQTNTTGKNEADVDQVILQRTGATQQATQDCRIEQMNGSGDNFAHVRQSISQSTNQASAGAQNQDAYQVLELEQSTGGSGKNAAQVEQTQDQRLLGPGTLQNQNAGGGQALPDCDAMEVPNQPNQCVAIEQTAQNGRNDLHLKQSIDENAHTNLTADQQQGSFEGGIEGDVHQTIVTGGTGSSHNNADERKHQIAHGGTGSVQNQTDPTRCCSFSQVGGVNNTEDIDQNIHQQANGDDFFQNADVIAQSNTGGRCTLSHNVHQNDARANVTFTNEPCPTTQLVTNCQSAGGSSSASFTMRDETGQAQLAGLPPGGGSCFTTCPTGFTFNTQTGNCDADPPSTTIFGPASRRAPSLRTAPSWSA